MVSYTQETDDGKTRTDSKREDCTSREGTVVRLVAGRRWERVRGRLGKAPGVTGERATALGPASIT